MKSVYSVLMIVAALFSFANVSSQPYELPAGVLLKQSAKANFPWILTRNDEDTLFTPYVEALVNEDPIGNCTDVQLFGDVNGGYVVGNNSRGDKEKMQKFGRPPDVGVVQTLVYFMFKSVANPDSNLYSILYKI